MVGTNWVWCQPRTDLLGQDDRVAFMGAIEMWVGA